MYNHSKKVNEGKKAIEVNENTNWQLRLYP